MVPCTFNGNEAVLAKQCLNKGECKRGKFKINLFLLYSEWLKCEVGMSVCAKRKKYLGIKCSSLSGTAVVVSGEQYAVSVKQEVTQSKKLCISLLLGKV